MFSAFWFASDRAAGLLLSKTAGHWGKSGLQKLTEFVIIY